MPETKDTELPKIVAGSAVPSPTDCQVYKRGDSIPFRYAMEDNMQLGAFNIEVHHNFDNHTHGTQGAVCQPPAKKEPVNPWVFNKSYTIPEEYKTRYEAGIDIPIPEDIDPGYYHFVVRLLDAAGWQEMKAMGIVIE